MRNNSSMTFQAIPPKPAFQAATQRAPAKRSRPTPISIRVSDAEREQIKEAAGPLSVNAYVRSQLFGKRQAVTTHHESRQLAQVLAVLGKTDLSSNFRMIAEAARIGALHVCPETELAILQACEDVASIKSMVMDALNIAER